MKPYFIPITVAGFFLIQAAFGQTQTATVLAQCRSLSLGEFYGAHPEFGWLIYYVTTYDGTTGMPLHELIGEDFYNSEELRPAPDPIAPTVYQADYVTLIDDELVSYGELTLGLPAADTDESGLPDVLQWDKAVDIPFSGNGRPDFRAEGVPLNPFTISNGHMIRQARLASGQYFLTMVEPEPVGTITLEGLFTLRLVRGTADYSRGDANEISFDLMAEDMESKFTGQASFVVVSPDEIALPQFELDSPQGVIAVRPTTLTRQGKIYRGNMQLEDGDLVTSWPDYTEWVLAIVDQNDADGDGVPDLSDALPPPNIPPIVTLVLPRSGSSFVAPSIIMILAEARDPDGGIRSVEFFEGATKLGEETQPLYSCVWRAVPAGSYTLTARATDYRGATSDSAPVLITIRDPDPGGIVYSACFETNEGYAAGQPLVGQGTWDGNHSSVYSGIVADGIQGEGQSAYIGLHPLDGSTNWLSVVNTLNFDALAARTPLLTFSALLKIIPSTNGNTDSFYWSVYGADETYLFSLIFISGWDVQYTPYTGRRISTYHSLPTDQFQLDVSMDLEQNRWAATVDGIEIVGDQQIAQYPSKLSLGSVRAEWESFPGWSGDNCMLFDNLRLLASAVRIQLTGEPDRSYVLDSTLDFAGWTQLGDPIRSSSGGVAVFPDIPISAGHQRFYRCCETQ